MAESKEDSPRESSRGKRVKRNSSEWLKNVKRNIRNSKEARAQPHVACQHQEESWCKANTELSEHDIKKFFDELYKNETYNAQNQFITPFLVPYTGENQRHRNENPREKLMTQYVVRKVDRTLVIVCAKSFSSITGLTRKRLNNISKHFFLTGSAKKDKRGGGRQTEQQKEVISSILVFIKKLKVDDSHYARSKSTRQYLPSELSVAKLWRMWKQERMENNMPVTSISKFTVIFNTRFNLAFKCPRVDVCSYCEIMDAKIRLDINRAENLPLLKLHRARAKRFYEILRESAKAKDILTITFDMQQVQPLPKTNVGEAYYSRQLGIFNLTFVIHVPKKIKKQNVHIYTWLESEAAKGSNEVTSAMAHFFKKVIFAKLKRHQYAKIELFSDSCGGQNKNSTMLAFLLHLMNNPDVYKYTPTIDYYFPIRGHSFLPPDRVFGQIERILRKTAIIKTPAQYQEVYGQFGKVHVYGDDWRVYSYKQQANTMLKNIGLLSMQKNRVWTFSRRHQGVVGVRNSYWGNPQLFNILKPSITMLLPHYKPILLPDKSAVSEQKKNDVRKLLQLVDLTPTEKEFYNTELAKPSYKKDIACWAKEVVEKKDDVVEEEPREIIIDNMIENVIIAEEEGVPSTSKERGIKRRVLENPGTPVVKRTRGRPRKVELDAIDNIIIPEEGVPSTSKGRGMKRRVLKSPAAAAVVK